MILLPFYVDNIIKTALFEDINYIDSTADLLIPENSYSDAYLMAKADGVVCGSEVAARVFTILDPSIDVKFLVNEGERVSKGQKIATINGHTREMLKAERTALNIIQHMSGIATYTRRCVDAVEGTKATIADTRKTLPGLRALQKYAVTVGGGRNHRYNLTDAAMLKDNHIGAAGGVSQAIRMAKEYAPFVRKIEVEVEDLDMVREAVEAGADIIMLDNMTAEDMREAVKLIDGRAETECSGNVTRDNVERLIEIGVDYISSGALTHSAPILDISLKNLHPVE